MRTSPSARVYQRNETVVATLVTAPNAKQKALEDRGVVVWTFPPRGDHIDLRQLLEKAGTQGITSILLEGGSELAAAALADQVVDEVMIFQAPLLLGAGVASIGSLGIERVDDGIGLRQVRMRRLGDDILITGEVNYSCSPD